MALLVELTVFNLSTELEETQYYSDRGFITGDSDTPPHKSYLPLIESFNLGRNLSSASSLVGGSTLDTGQIVLTNTDGSLDSLSNFSFDGRKIVIRYSNANPLPAIGSFTAIYEGTVLDALVGQKSVTLRLRDKRERMNRPVQHDKYKGQSIGLHLDGVDAHIDLPIEASPLNNSTFTIEWWFRAGRGLQSSSSGCMLRILYNSEDLRAYSASDSNSNQIGLSFIIGGTSFHYREENLADVTKHHVAIVKPSSGDGKIYLDGVDVDNWDITKITSGFAATLVRLGAFGTVATPSQFWEGDMYDVRFWSTARTQDEVNEFKDSTLVGDEVGLIAHYKLDEGIDITRGITSDPDGTGEFHNPNQRDDVITLDSSDAVAGSGIGVINGNTSWVALLDAIELEGIRKLLPIGTVSNVAPDLVVGDSQIYSLSSDSIRRVNKVREGGGALFSTGYLELDGVDQYVTIPTIAAYNLGTTGVATYEMIFTGTDGNVGRLFDIGDALQPNTRVVITPGSAGSNIFANIVDSAGGGAAFINGDVIIGDGGRHQASLIVSVLDLYIALYYDGRLVGTKILSALSGDFDWLATWNLGRKSVTDDSHLDGEMHQFRVWDRIRTSAEIQEDLLTDLVGNETGLIGYWDFDDGSGTTVTDKSSNSNDGTTVNSPTWLVKDYDVVNNRTGCSIALKVPPSHPIRYDADGWLPNGWGIKMDDAPPSSKRVIIANDSSQYLDGTHTICWWFNFDPSLVTASSYIARYSTGTSVEGYWDVLFSSADGGFLRWKLVTSSGSSTWITTFLPGAKDEFVALVFDEGLGSNERSLYVDGVLHSQFTTAGTLTSAPTGSLFLLDALKGAMVSDLRIINRALSSDDIARIQYKGVDPSDPDLVGRYFYKEDANDTSLTFFDSSNSNKGQNDAVATTNSFNRFPGPFPSSPSEIVRWVAGMDGVRGTAGDPAQPTDGPAIPGDEFDTASIATFDTDTGSPPVGIMVRDETVAQVIDMALSPLGFWIPDLDGNLKLGVGRMPSESGDASVVTIPKNEQISITRMAVTLPSTEVSLLWLINFDPYSRDELIQAILERPKAVETLTRPGRSIRRVVNGVEKDHLLAVPSEIITTFLVSKVDAETVVEWIRGNRSAIRTPYMVKLRGAQHGFLGQVAKLDENPSSSQGVISPRFDFDSDELDVLVIRASVRLDAISQDLITDLTVIA